MKKFWKQESGQSAVMVALLLTVLLGAAALAVDAGRVHYAQIDLQDAADAAALAGAGKLPSYSAAESTATSLAVQNGAVPGRVTVTTQYMGDPTLVRVDCSMTLPYTFGKIIGYSNGEITATAVAKRNASVWAGESLPFVNLDNLYPIGAQIRVWESTGPGTYESMWKDEYTYVDDPDNPHFDIQYTDGIMVTSGVVATVKQEILEIYNHCVASGQPIYVFSLSEAAITSGKYLTHNGSVANKTNIELEDLVLLKVNFDYFQFVGGNSANCYLTVLDVYDLQGAPPVDAGYNRFGGSASLIA